MQKNIKVPILITKSLPIFFFLGIAVSMPSFWFIGLAVILVINIAYLFIQTCAKKAKIKILIATGVLVVLLLLDISSRHEPIKVKDFLSLFGLYFFYLQTVILRDGLGEIHFISSYMNFFNQNPIYQSIRLFFNCSERKNLYYGIYGLLMVLLFIIYYTVFKYLYSLMVIYQNQSFYFPFFWMAIFFVALLLFSLIIWPLFGLFEEEKVEDENFLFFFAAAIYFISTQMSDGEMKLLEDFFKY